MYLRRVNTLNVAPSTRDRRLRSSDAKRFGTVVYPDRRERGDDCISKGEEIEKG